MAKMQEVKQTMKKPLMVQNDVLNLMKENANGQSRDTMVNKVYEEDYEN